MQTEEAREEDDFWYYRTVIFHRDSPSQSAHVPVLSNSPSDLQTPLSATDSAETPGSAYHPSTPFDFSKWVDLAPLALSIHSPSELVLEVFIKLGVRMVCVVEDGKFVGVIHKKRLLGFVSARSRL
jgi:hypothetical protein